MALAKWRVAAVIASIALVMPTAMYAPASAAPEECDLPAPLLMIGNSGAAEELTRVRIVAPDGAAGVRIIEKWATGSRVTKDLDGENQALTYENSEAWNIDYIYARAFCSRTSYASATVQLPVGAPYGDNEADVRAVVAPSGLTSLLQASVDVFADTAVDCAKSKAFSLAWKRLNTQLTKSKNRYVVIASTYSQWIQSLDDELWQDGCERAGGIVTFYASFGAALFKSKKPVFFINSTRYSEDLGFLGSCTVDFNAAVRGVVPTKFQDKYDREECLGLPARLLD